MPMFTFGDTYAELQALFTAVFSGNWSTLAQNAASPATNLYLSLHNADPGDGGSQNTSETAYTNYVRLAVARSTSGFTVTLGSGSTPSNVVNAATASFAQCGATGDTITHVGVGTASSGAGILLAYAPVGPIAGPFVDWTSTLASPAVFTCPGYTPTLNDRVSIYPSPQSGSLGNIPAAFTAGTVYYAVSVSGTTFQLATTSSGTGINGATAGSGILYKQSPLVVGNGVTPSFAAGQLVWYKS
jgi:hypothetical protein